MYLIGVLDKYSNIISMSKEQISHKYIDEAIKAWDKMSGDLPPYHIFLQSFVDSKLKEWSSKWVYN